MSKRTVVSLTAALLLTALPLSALEEETPEEHAKWIKANYTKFEYMIPMRDGVKLFSVRTER